jgi:hypothetical protein
VSAERIRLVVVHLPTDGYPLYGYVVAPEEEVPALRELAESKDLRCTDHSLAEPDKLRAWLEAL